MYNLQYAAVCICLVAMAGFARFGNHESQDTIQVLSDGSKSVFPSVYWKLWVGVLTVLSVVSVILTLVTLCVLTANLPLAPATQSPIPGKTDCG